MSYGDVFRNKGNVLFRVYVFNRDMSMQCYTFRTSEEHEEFFIKKTAPMRNKIVAFDDLQNWYEKFFKEAKENSIDIYFGAGTVIK